MVTIAAISLFAAIFNTHFSRSQRGQSCPSNAWSHFWSSKLEATVVVAMGELPLTITGTVTRPSAEVEKLWSPLCRELLAPRPARCVCGPHTTLQGRGDPSHPPVGGAMICSRLPSQLRQSWDLNPDFNHPSAHYSPAGLSSATCLSTSLGYERLPWPDARWMLDTHPSSVHGKVTG